jgi:hypothetical protein
MLVERGDWVELGASDEQKPAKPGTVEAWAREASNPVGGWHGLRKGYRGSAWPLPPLGPFVEDAFGPSDRTVSRWGVRPAGRPGRPRPGPADARTGR